ncbi:MAG: type I restriction enzyme HsdR N-terminal domain-containing protein [Deltaproteobacteria bacterium]|nr:type I restriction enzyme HsdR N-terminal domain-containing protein [Deltaproteobacteria bacterium]
MDFADRIKDLSTRVAKQTSHLSTEEATKTALVMPFISALGYDVFNPIEVIPEFTTDVGTKKGEKVDYAVKKDDKIILLFECKCYGSDLEKEPASQLYRYFSVSEARFGILTDGVTYKFYSDIEDTNKMDEKPFFTFNLDSFEDHQIIELKKFTKSAFDLSSILNTASTLKYTNEIKKAFANEINNPSEEFIKYLIGLVYSGVKTKNVVNEFTIIVKEALKQYVKELVNDRLQSAIKLSYEQEEDQDAEQEQEESDDGIITTEEEIEGYHIVKAIIRDMAPPEKIVMRDLKAFCAILYDDNIRKPICKLWFNNPNNKYISIIINKEEAKIKINNLNDIYQYADQLRTAVTQYLNPN